MTEQTPTEAEIWELILDAWTMTVPTAAGTKALVLCNVEDFARAVLAKWGSPVVAGVPWGASVGDRVWVGKLPAHVPKLAEAEGLSIQWLYTTPQPTQAQAGAVPQYRLLVRGQDTIQADDEFLREDGVTWRKDPSGIFVGCMYEGTILLPARRAIKEGDQHADT